MRIDLSVATDARTSCDIAITCAPGTRWGDVVDQVRSTTGLPPDARLWAGERPVRDDDVVGSDPLVVGTRLEPHRPPTRVTSLWRLEQVAGPAAGNMIPVPLGTVSIGRDPGCDVVIDDPAVSRRQASLEPGVAGLVVTDHGSANGTHVNGSRVTSRQVGTGDLIRWGDTVLRLSAAGASTGTRDSQQVPDVIDIPRPATRSGRTLGRWLGVAAPVLLALWIALASHDLRLLAFAAVSPLSLAASLFDRSQRHGWRARRREHRQRSAAERAVVEARTAEARRRRAEAPDPVSFGNEITARARPPGGSSERRRIRLGLSDLASSVRERHGGEERVGHVALVPVSVDIGGAEITLDLPRKVARALARWIVLQILRQAPHATDVTVTLVIDTDAELDWTWARWLPRPPIVSTDPESLHPAHATRFRPPVDSAGEGFTRHVIVVDSTRRVARPARASGTTVILIGANARNRGDVHVTSGATANQIVVDDARDGAQCAGSVIADQVSVDWAEKMARSLSASAETRAGDGAGVPVSCDLVDVLDLGDDARPELQRRWLADLQLRVPIGRCAVGALELDLTKDGPHALVAGTTGSGKSEFLQAWILSLAAVNPPERLAFVLVDFKGGATFGALARLPHVCGVLSDLEVASAQRAIDSLRAELRRREQVLAGVGAADIDAHALATGATGAAPLHRLMIVVDEFAALADELPELMQTFVAVAQRGRSLGMHLVLATQRPAGAVSSDIRANVALRIALRTSDPADSLEVIGADDAFRIAPNLPGRALALRGGVTTEFQAGAVSRAHRPSVPTVQRLGRWRDLDEDHDAPQVGRDVDALVSALEDAARSTGRAPVRAPWCQPLPEQITISDLDLADDSGVFGMVDRPDAQDQVPLRADLRHGGSLLVTGGPGSGRTTALLALAEAARRTSGSAASVHLVAVDCAGGGLAGQLGECCDVVDDGTPDALGSCLERLSETLRARRRDLGLRRAPDAPRADHSSVLLVIDGWDELVELSHRQDRGRSADLVLTMMRGCARTGVSVALTGGRSTLAPSVAGTADVHLLLRPGDITDLNAVGLHRRARPARWPPGRALRLSDGYEVQLTRPFDQPMWGYR